MSNGSSTPFEASNTREAKEETEAERLVRERKEAAEAVRLVCEMEEKAKRDAADREKRIAAKKERRAATLKARDTRKVREAEEKAEQEAAERAAEEARKALIKAERIAAEKKAREIREAKERADREAAERADGDAERQRVLEAQQHAAEHQKLLEIKQQAEGQGQEAAKQNTLEASNKIDQNGPGDVQGIQEATTSVTTQNEEKQKPLEAKQQAEREGQEVAERVSSEASNKLEKSEPGDVQSIHEATASVISQNEQKQEREAAKRKAYNAKRKLHRQNKTKKPEEDTQVGILTPEHVKQIELGIQEPSVSQNSQDISNAVKNLVGMLTPEHVKQIESAIQDPSLSQDSQDLSDAVNEYLQETALATRADTALPETVEFKDMTPQEKAKQIEADLAQMKILQESVHRGKMLAIRLFARNTAQALSSEHDRVLPELTSTGDETEEAAALEESMPEIEKKERIDTPEASDTGEFVGTKQTPPTGSLFQEMLSTAKMLYDSAQTHSSEPHWVLPELASTGNEPREDPTVEKLLPENRKKERVDSPGASDAEEAIEAKHNPRTLEITMLSSHCDLPPPALSKSDKAPFFNYKGFAALIVRAFFNGNTDPTWEEWVLAWLDYTFIPGWVMDTADHVVQWRKGVKQDAPPFKDIQPALQFFRELDDGSESDESGILTPCASIEEGV
ncbi:hypothetical protein EJ08DRAFT_473891 [Tothia fuscella]|uniref:Uncharacterized protein n=1 Tax=Tothia fuscella TaxID=1048955 RepID=A0A9P4U2A7_9PEZI|nr:hypothetical protein EJ08DRAFT_473891 [Tothia fuscella]